MLQSVISPATIITDRNLKPQEKYYKSSLLRASRVWDNQNMTKPQTWRDRLKATLTAKKMKKSAFADAVGIAQPTASAKLNGTRGASVEEVAKFARAVGVPPAWLAYGDETNEAELLRDLEALPEGWREYLRQKAKRMRAAAEAQHPLMLKSVPAAPPSEQELNHFLDAQPD